MKGYFTCLFCIVAVVGSAQKVTVSEPIALKGDASYHIIGNLKGHILLFRDQETTFKVEAFDQNLRLSWNKELELEKHRAEILDVISDADGFDVIYRFKRKGHTFLKVHKYDPAANLLDSATVKDMGSLFFTPYQQVVVSDNKQMAMVYSVKDLTRVEGTAVDLEKLKVVWDSSIEPDDFYAPQDFRKILLDNIGNAYIITEKDNRRSQKEQHRFVVYADGPSFAGLTTTNIPVTNFLTYDADFTFDNINRAIVCAGLYSDNNINRSAGYFLLKIPLAASANYLVKSYPYSENAIAVITGKEVEKNKELSDISVREIVLRQDGGVLLLAERIRTYERQSAGLARSSIDRFARSVVDYYYDDLFVASIHPDGEKHWENVLPKKQYSQDDDAIFSSVFVMKTARNLRLVFNDEIRNESTVSEYVLLPGGQLDRNSLFNTENQDLKLRFRDAHQISANEFIVPSERRNRLKLVRVTF